MIKRLTAKASTIALAAAVAAPAPVFAQTIADQIVVTATKRTENVQDVPIAISAYSGDLLDKSGVSDIRELSILSPSIVVVATQSEATGVNARIRGVGTVGDNPGLQSSVGVFIDEVYRSRNSVALGDLGEIAAIEVARGPQGTLFGRNSSAGALIVRSKQPVYEFEGYGEYTRQNFDGDRFEGAINIPIGETIATRINGFYEERDGFLEDVISGNALNDRDQFGFRGQVLWEPTDALSFRLIGDYAERNENCCASVRIIRGPTTPIADALTGGVTSSLPLDPFERETAISPGRTFKQDVEDYGASLQANWDVGAAQITSVTAYREFDISRSQDSDLTGPDIFFRPENGGFENTFETFTQELRANGQAGPLDWLVGVYYANEDVALQDQQTYGSQYELYNEALLGAAVAGSPLEGVPLFSSVSGLAPGTVFAGAGQDDNHLAESRSIAVFTNNTFDVTDRLAITLGGRYTNEQIDYTGSLSSVNPACGAVLTNLGLAAAGMPANPVVAGVAGNPALAGNVAVLSCLLNITPITDGDLVGDREENEFTWDAKLTYQITDNISFYGGAARGYKAGGFNLDRAGGPNTAITTLGGATQLVTGDSLEFEEETVINYEAGFKTVLLGGNATFNVTGFYAEYEDYQLNTFNGISFLVENIDEVISSGVEVDFIAQPIEQIYFQGGWTYANTRYGDDITSSIISSNGLPLNGRRITLAPLHSVTGAMTVTEQLLDTDYDFFFNWNFRFTTDFNTGSDLDPEKVQEDFFVVNASIGLLAQDNGLEVEAFARNLLDADYFQVAFDTPLQAGSFNAFLGDPRTYGLTVRYRF
ncbi:MAG: TonB-dependent receptor [Pseudomonadota bacterium]